MEGSMLRVFQVTLLGACLGGILVASAAWSAPVVTACGTPISSIIKTETAGHSTSSTVFRSLPSARVVVTVPSGHTRCIKVLFTAETKCDQLCYIRAADNTTLLHPTTSSAGDLVFDGNTESAAAHALAWVRRVGPGSHTIDIQLRSSNSSLFFYVFAWTMIVEVTN